MSYSNGSGIGVYNQYGARETGGAVGIEHSKSGVQKFHMDLTGASISEGNANGFVPEVYLPKGALIVSAVLRVDEAFSLGGTTPAVEVGTLGSEVTNGVTLSEADLEAIGTYDVSAGLAGTWTAGLAANTQIGIALSGTTPTISTSVGKGTLFLEYVSVAKA